MCVCMCISICAYISHARVIIHVSLHSSCVGLEGHELDNTGLCRTLFVWWLYVCESFSCSIILQHDVYKLETWRSAIILRPVVWCISWQWTPLSGLPVYCPSDASCLDQQICPSVDGFRFCVAITYWVITERRIWRRMFGPTRDRVDSWKIKTNNELN